ncbi:hypothetical protein [Brucella sp. NF 2653]|uniref:hypothetical protein n=1 Tax=unclassified Brucella TaxID=2632610 RepID=UPI003D0A6F0F
MIVLRGGLAAILTFASGKKNPAFLEEKALPEDLLGRAQESKKALAHARPQTADKPLAVAGGL